MSKLSRPAAALLAFGGIAGMTAVGGAAFAVHGLAKMTSVEPERAVSLFQQGTTFQMNHALSMILATLLSERVGAGLAQTVLRLSAFLMALAMILFPGAVYSASFGGPQFWAPYGGNAAMLGWLAFSVGALLTLRGEAAGDKARMPQPQAAE